MVLAGVQCVLAGQSLSMGHCWPLNRCPNRLEPSELCSPLSLVLGFLVLPSPPKPGTMVLCQGLRGTLNAVLVQPGCSSPHRDVSWWVRWCMAFVRSWRCPNSVVISTTADALEGLQWCSSDRFSILPRPGALLQAPSRGFPLTQGTSCALCV